MADVWGSGPIASDCSTSEEARPTPALSSVFSLASQPFEAATPSDTSFFRVQRQLHCTGSRLALILLTPRRILPTSCRSSGSRFRCDRPIDMIPEASTGRCCASASAGWRWPDIGGRTGALGSRSAPHSASGPFGRAANLPSTRPRKPTDADMGPHNWGGGEARPEGWEDEGQAGEVIPSARGIRPLDRRRGR